MPNFKIAATLLGLGVVVHGKACYPSYSPGSRYTVGDRVSSAHLDTIAFTGKVREAIFNYVCRDDASAELCSSDELAPGGPNDLWSIAWEREEDECRVSCIVVAELQRIVFPIQ